MELFFRTKAFCRTRFYLIDAYVRFDVMIKIVLNSQCEFYIAFYVSLNVWHSSHFTRLPSFQFSHLLLRLFLFLKQLKTPWNLFCWTPILNMFKEFCCEFVCIYFGKSFYQSAQLNSLNYSFGVSGKHTDRCKRMLMIYKIWYWCLFCNSTYSILVVHSMQLHVNSKSHYVYMCAELVYMCVDMAIFWYLHSSSLLESVVFTFKWISTLWPCWHVCVILCWLYFCHNFGKTWDNHFHFSPIYKIWFWENQKSSTFVLLNFTS